MFSTPFLSGYLHHQLNDHGYPNVIPLCLSLIHILVYEPLWTAIPSNKAILPVLWSLFPNHRYLLEAGFELTPELIKNGYAQKPIAGRRGDNVKLIGECKSVLDSTDGRFDKQESIYPVSYTHLDVYKRQVWCSCITS